MIPVAAKPEPAAFDAAVRQKGLAHLILGDFPLNLPLPPNADIEPYWRACLTDLHQAYGGVCAYLCVFFERVMGGGSVDHFIAKSANAGLAYEWDNYRLACSTMNSRKREYSDVLDPFFLAPDQFRLQLSTGHIYPNQDLNAAPMRLVEHGMAEGKGEDLIRAKRRVVAVLAVHHVKQMAAFLRPKAAVE